MAFSTDKELSDSLDDLIGGVDVTKAANPVALPAGYVPNAAPLVVNKFKETRQYTEPCRKCRGSGRYHGPSSHGSRCFECDGVGTKTFRTSPEQRAKKKTAAHSRKAVKAQEIATASARAGAEWLAARPDIAAWFVAEKENTFAQSLFGALNRFGSLTDGQIAAIHRSFDRKAEAAARVAAAPTVDTTRIHEAFDAALRRAQNKGLRLRYPTITVGAVTISPAGPNSKNPGALYVKNRGEYVGKIVEGRLLGTRECTPEIEQKIVKFIADPQAAAKAYGQETGTCCICNATLTSKWKLQGIGPVCATKFGW